MTDKPDEATIEAMHNESIRQYNLVIGSIDGLNNKAIGIIAFNGTLLSLFSLSVLQFINSQHLNNLQTFLTGVTISYVLILFSIICSIYSYRVIEVNSVDAKKLHTDYYTESRQTVLDQLCSNISDDCDLNREIAETKSKFINYSLICLIIGVISISISLIYGFYNIIQ